MPLAKQSSVAILDENDTTNDYVKVFKAISQLFKKADSGPINSAKTSEFYALARGMGDEVCLSLPARSYKGHARVVGVVADGLCARLSSRQGRRRRGAATP